MHPQAAAVLREIFPRASSSTDRLTEAGAAERFVQQHADDLRYDYRRDRWLLWRGHHWAPDVDAAITRYALAFARGWQRDALAIEDRDRREAAIKFAIRLERRDALNNMLALARALKPIADAGEGWDADPWLLGVRNGVIDLKRGELRAGRRDDCITMQAAVEYDPDAPADRWLRFVAEIFDGHEGLASYVQRAVGYSLTGLTVEQVLFLLYGTGSNGKGTFANLLKRVLGDYAWNMPFATIELRDRAAIPNDVAALMGRRFVTGSETNDGSRLNEARVKMLTGSDPVTARFLHGEFFTFEPVGKFWLSVNHKPVVRDDSHGFWRRLRLIPFTRTFPTNAELGEALSAELPGILAWAVRGVLAWQQDGLEPPDVVVQATREYQTDSDALAGFIEEACDLQDTAEVGAAELFDHYRRWADRSSLPDSERLTKTGFGRKMSERFEYQRSRTGKVYRGLARRPL